MSGHADAWDQFLSWMLSARRRMEDPWVPVAVICLQADARSDGAMDLKPWNNAAVIWPAEFPVDERGPLLKRLAKPYDEGTVLRSAGGGAD
jgi:hypothetical protein